MDVGRRTGLVGTRWYSGVVIVATADHAVDCNAPAFFLASRRTTGYPVAGSNSVKRLWHANCSSSHCRLQREDRGRPPQNRRRRRSFKSDGLDRLPPDFLRAAVELILHA